MDYIRKYIAGQQGDSQPTGAETVERLCERARTSTLLEDRRDAVRGLKALSKKFCLEVGTKSMELLMHILKTDRSDTEITGYALETLCNVMSNQVAEDESEAPYQLPEDLGGQFTEIFIKNNDNVTLLLSLLEEYEFHIRWPTVKLITILLSNRSRSLQEFILVSPMGVSRLMDLLSDSREIIRNDALLLLTQLTKGNASIQKIVAFENGFERLLDIIVEEGSSDGGIVVEDCLLLLLNLLTGNPSNQTFFKEGSYIQRLTPYFGIVTDDNQALWSAQKVTNIHLMLQLIRTLVSPNNPQLQTCASQSVMSSCGLLQQLCSILMTSGVPAEVLTETINTVSEVIRGCPANQEYFASVMAPSSPPRPAIVVLLMSMVNEKQPFVLRCAVLYCFQSFLYKNDIGQMQIVQTLLPKTTDVNTITAGQLLCGGLFSQDSLSNWFAAVALLHAILDNPKQKEELLRVQLAASVGNPSVSLLQQCCNMLSQGGKAQTRIGLLMIISVWLVECSIAVAHFLNNQSNVPYLITQISSSQDDELEGLVQGLCAFILGLCVQYSDDQSDASSFNRDSLERIIRNRIGFDMFHDKLQQISKSEHYTRAAKIAHLNYKEPANVIFDHAFTKLFKDCEYEMVMAMKSTANGKGQKKSATSIKDHENIVDSYKQVIKEQDTELQRLKAEFENLQLTSQVSSNLVEELQCQVQELKDQNSVLKTSRDLSPPQSKQSGEEVSNEGSMADIEVLQTMLATSNDQVEHLQSSLAEKDALILELKSLQHTEVRQGTVPETSTNTELVSSLETELMEMRNTCSQKDHEIETLKSKLNNSISTTPSQIPDAESESKLSDDSHALNVQIETLSQERETLTSQGIQLREEITQLQKQCDEVQEKFQNSQASCESLEKSVATLEKDKSSLQAEVDTVKAEQEDLLVLLADHDAKLSMYKAKLKELGEQVDDDDDEELDDLESEEDED